MRKKTALIKEERYGYTEEEFKKFRKYAWISLLLTSFFYSMIYCVRLNVSSAGPIMMEELGFTEGDIGILTATLFWTYAAGMIHGNLICRKLGCFWTIVISSVTGIVADIIFGFTTNFTLMVILWALNGFAQGFFWPACCQVFGDWWPGKKHGFAIGLASGFTGLSTALVSITVAWGLSLFPEWGWRAAFWFPALFPIVGAILFFLFNKMSPRSIGLKDYEETNEEFKENEEEASALLKKEGVIGGYKFLLKSPDIVSVAINPFFSGILRYGTFTWIPLYFVQQFNVDIKAGLFASAALPLGMAIGSFVVPLFTDRMKNRAKIIPPLSLLTAVFVILFLFLNPNDAFQFVLIEVVLFIAGFLIYAICGVQNVIACDVAGRTLSPMANGLNGLASYLGAGVQAVVYGFLLETIGWNGVFVSIAALAILIAIIVVISERQRSKRQKK